MDSGVYIAITGIIAATLRLSTPLIFAALGGVFSEKAGVVNIALEGIMTTGAFFAVYGSFVTGSPWMGLIFAMIAGAAMAAIHAYLSIHLKAEQVVSGVAINIFAGALTSFLIVKFFKTGSQTSVVKSIPYPSEMMGKVPFIGSILKELNWFVFIAFILVFVSHYVIYKTPLGLRIRSVGEHPKAADTLGVSVYGIRYFCVILSGVLGGLGGATLSIGIMNLYRENMVSGRGFIALAAMIFGNWKPINAMWASMLFAFAETFQLFAKGFGWTLPGEVYAAFPYILTMLALAGFVGKTQAPAADGVPYEKGQR
ncbi:MULTISPECIES: ABC transporter permease [unclassified Clostridium]|uniref:ABC transporter permease n=1 Tax=unclassified Clostridium TaxID=2614128 RepID=UPI00052BA9F1|nr:MULTISPECIES: ABC transporter permease [unclassified Clostridium]KGK90773.1 branched-chain amino acid ABC transporter permease [Clostridium sp. HMP27]